LNVRAVVQRVSEARVHAGGSIVANIGAGLCVLLGVATTDTPQDAARLAARIAGLRVFENDRGRMDRSVLDTGWEVLVVSQFTLIADTSRGRRPSFSEAAPAELAERLYEQFCTALESEGVQVSKGEFGARMLVEIANDGPVTIVLET
jgi:D-tyrosyl-tRNA(Tyr) deacylase